MPVRILLMGAADVERELDDEFIKSKAQAVYTIFHV